MKKYGFTGEQKEATMSTGEKVVVLQIQALIDMPAIQVSKGDLGGWLFDGSNLSQSGLCWVSEDSVVSGGAVVEGDAYVGDKSSIETYSVIRNNVRIENSQVREFSIIEDNAVVRDSVVFGKSMVMEYVVIDNSNIQNIAISRGNIKDSRVISKNERLEFGAPVVILDSHLVIAGNNNSVTQACSFEDVKGMNFTTFQIDEPSTFERIRFEGGTYLKIGAFSKDLSSKKTRISGDKESLCQFENAVSWISNSTIEGDVLIKGTVLIENSQVTDATSILNHSKTLLKVENVKLSDLATIEKKNSKQGKIVDAEIGGDTLVTI